MKLQHRIWRPRQQLFEAVVGKPARFQPTLMMIDYGAKPSNMLRQLQMNTRQQIGR